MKNTTLSGIGGGVKPALPEGFRQNKLSLTIKNKEKNGFSLAEMMVVLLIVAVVLAATAPMITRRISRDRSDKIFDILNSDPTNAVEYVKGRNQRIYMDSRANGYVGIRESGEKIPTNSVIFGYNRYSKSSTNFVGIGFNTENDQDTVAIGYNSHADSKGSVAIGSNAKTSTMSIAQSKYSTAIGYNSKITGASRSTAIGYNAQVGFGISEATAIGYNAKAELPNTIVLGTEKDTVYIPGNLVVGQDTLLGASSTDEYGNKKNHPFYFRPAHAEEDGIQWATLQAQDYKGGEDLVMTYNDDGSMGATVGPYKVIGHRVGGAAYKDNRKYCMNGNFNSGGGWCTSDIRLKDVGETFNGGLEELNKLKFYNFTFKNDNDKQPHVGVMAQELEQVFPNAVKKDKDGWLQIRWDEMFYSAINAIKELNAKVIAIAEKLQDISKDITELKTKTEKQQSEIDNQAKLITTQQQELEKLSERIEKLEHNK